MSWFDTDVPDSLSLEITHLIANLLLPPTFSSFWCCYFDFSVMKYRAEFVLSLNGIHCNDCN